MVDLLKRERPGGLLLPVNITGEASETRNGAYYGVPKRDLVTGMQVLLQSGGLQIAAGMPYGAALLEEMADMRAKVTTAGNTQFGVWREGAHDDLVLAVALACRAARKRCPHGPYGEAAYWKRTEQGDWDRGRKCGISFRPIRCDNVGKDTSGASTRA